MTAQTFDDRMEEFRQRLEFMYAHANCPHTFVLVQGRRVVKVAFKRYAGYDSLSVYCFVDMRNGDILKAASWKNPAKDARGSIWNADCDVGPDKPCNVHGGNLYKRSV